MKKSGLIVVAVLWLALGAFVTIVNTAAEHRAAAEAGHGEAPVAAEKSGSH